MDAKLVESNSMNFLNELDKLLENEASAHANESDRPGKWSADQVQSWHKTLRSAAIRLRERSLPDPWYEAREAKDGAAFWLRLAHSAPNFR